MTGWPKGWYDTAFINIDDNAVWPSSGLKGNSAYSSTAILLIWTIFTGHVMCEIQLIFWPIPPRGLEGTWWSNQFLLYVARLDNVLVRNMDFDEVTGMHILKWVQRASGMPISDVGPLSQVQALAPVVPRFGPKANPCLTAKTSSHYSTSFSIIFSTKSCFMHCTPELDYS